MNYEQFIEGRIIEQNKKNMDDFEKYLNSSAGKLKISNFIKKNSDLDIENIAQEALNGNPYAIAILRKDPTKQNVSENAFFDYVGIEKSPQSGPNRIVFGNSKAADFKLKGYYGTQKYIKDGGGAQDNQINDAVLFAEEGMKAGHKVMVCVDGAYGKMRINSLLTNSENCVIITADELKEGLANGRFEKDTTL